MTAKTVPIKEHCYWIISQQPNNIDLFSPRLKMYTLLPQRSVQLQKTTVYKLRHKY